ncbi:MAG: gamma-glutamyl-gamma-aminobutyrate hydrolase family protein [Nitrospirae bacterium]|nr:gamma-glutamyl-gamma-aminobutyrate hydrolase family protein [Nitrospirota bacterium]
MDGTRGGPRVAVALKSDDPNIMAKADPYLDWIRRGGGEPVIVVPDTRRPLAGVKGLLLIGGEDVAPERYGEVDRHCERINRERDAYEFTLIRSVLRRDLPTIAVCRGIQILAVALGSTLYQDIRREVTIESNAKRVVHRGARQTDTAHRIRIEKDSALADVIGRRTITVNSHHHQAIRDVPRSVRVAARSEDGLIEAIELPRQRFVLGVQWHPERWPHPSSARIMKGFLAACRDY